MIGAGGILLNLAYALVATRSSQPTISSGAAIGAGTVGTRNQTRPTDSPPDLPYNVTSCQRVRDATRRMRTFAIVTAHRAVSAAFCCAFFQFTNTFHTIYGSEGWGFESLQARD